MNSNTAVIWDKEFIKRHDVAGPRYTSYPTALQFNEDFSTSEHLAAIDRSNKNNRPLSIYIHLPFCESLCYYCACNKTITKNKDKIRQYVDHLIKEINMTAKAFGDHRIVKQIHLGGGTPTYLSGAELTEIWFHINKTFNLVSPEEGEYSIEVDPRTVDTEKLGLLKGLGFNRLSFGIQDFNIDVQEAINRVQSYELIESLMSASRDYNYTSVNFDLIYGLPSQTEKGVISTIEKVIELSPDRISLFNYAHLPTRFKAQRLLDEDTMPKADEKLQILCTASSMLIKAGYIYIGMDHFAKPTDDLAIALDNKELHRNFQGYTTHKDADLIGFGVSSISKIDNIYCQNSKSISGYESRIANKQSPLIAGVSLTTDDEIRREVIMSILCHNALDYSEISSLFNISFDSYFSEELCTIDIYEQQSLLTQTKTGFVVTDKGRLTIRKICMLFDAHLSNSVRENTRFSRII